MKRATGDTTAQWSGFAASSIDIVLRRFAEFHDLEGAFGRRAMIERAKGMLMQRHSTSEADAFKMPRKQSRAANRNLIDLAAACGGRHRLFPRKPESPTQH